MTRFERLVVADAARHSAARSVLYGGAFESAALRPIRFPFWSLFGGPVRDVAFTLFRLSPTFFFASCFLLGFGPTLRATVLLAGFGCGAFVLGRAVLPHLRARFPEWFVPEPRQMQALYRPDELHDGRDLESRLHRDLHRPSADHDAVPEDTSPDDAMFLPGIERVPQASESAPPEEPGEEMFLPGVPWVSGQRS